MLTKENPALIPYVGVATFFRFLTINSIVHFYKKKQIIIQNIIIALEQET